MVERTRAVDSRWEEHPSATVRWSATVREPRTR
jgi:hypothetical protein